MATASLAFPDTVTPTLSVLDPRGLVIRNVAYCRQRPEQTAEARITRQTFDAAGWLMASWDPRLWGTAPKPNLATVYGLSGQPLLTDSVDAGWQLNLPGEAGAPLSNWDRRGSQRHNEYDPLLRPIAISEWMAGESPRVVERFTYGDASAGFAAHNQCGQPVRHDDPAGTRRLADYAVNGLPLAEKRQFLDSLDLPDWPFDIQSRDDLLEDGEGLVTAQVYTASGEMQSQTDAMGNRRLFAYTLAGELKATRLQLAGAGEQPRVLVSAIHYNAFGQVESESAGNGVKTTADYAADDGRLIRLRAQVPGGKVLQDLNYGYDPVGNILSIEDKSQLIRYFKNQRTEPINRYRYDSLYQLVEATGREVITPSYGPALPLLQPTPLDPNQLRNYTQAFAYDRAGNLLIRQHSGAPTFGMATSRTSNRSLAQHDDGTLPDEDQIARGFDANGNQLELQRDQLMSWDARNQLSQVTLVKRDDGPDDQERYIYDRPGHRLRKVRLTQTGSRTLRAEVRYLAGLEIHRDAVTGEQRHVISVDAGRSRVRVLHWETTPPAGLGNDQLRYSLSDHLGSCTLELDKNAGLLSQEGYYPFGGTAWWAGSSVTETRYKTLRYSGKERDATGLYYYGYRYYAPWLQRWISSDPAQDVNGLNYYCFVGNAPAHQFDVDGRFYEGKYDGVERAVSKRGDHIVARGLKQFSPSEQETIINVQMESEQHLKDAIAMVSQYPTFSAPTLKNYFGCHFQDVLSDVSNAWTNIGAMTEAYKTADVGQDKFVKVYGARSTERAYVFPFDWHGRIFLHADKITNTADAIATDIHEKSHLRRVNRVSAVGPSTRDHWYLFDSGVLPGQNFYREGQSTFSSNIMEGFLTEAYFQVGAPEVTEIFISKVNELTRFNSPHTSLPSALNEFNRDALMRTRMASQTADNIAESAVTLGRICRGIVNS